MCYALHVLLHVLLLFWQQATSTTNDWSQCHHLAYCVLNAQFAISFYLC
jgi:hypothetical protein